MKSWKKINFKRAQAEEIEIMDLGHSIVRFTDYHWRIDDKIDVWPSTRKYLKGGKIGFYEKMKDVL
jgi:hypothetical protein